MKQQITAEFTLQNTLSILFHKCLTCGWQLTITNIAEIQNKTNIRSELQLSDNTIKPVLNDFQWKVETRVQTGGTFKAAISGIRLTSHLSMCQTLNELEWPPGAGLDSLF